MWFLRRHRKAEQHDVVLGVYFCGQWGRVYPHTYEVKRWGDAEWLNEPRQGPVEYRIVTPRSNISVFRWGLCGGQNCPTE